MPSQRLKVGIDISNAIDLRPSGISQYICRLIQALQLLNELELTLYCRRSKNRIRPVQEVFPDHIIQWLDPWTRFKKLDLYHATDVRIPWIQKKPIVTTTHDLVNLNYTDHASPGFIRKKRKAYRKAARNSTLLITQTQVIANQICDRLSTPSDRIRIVPLAACVDPPSKTYERESFLLVVGGPSPRKGFDRLGPLWQQWKEQLNWQPEIYWVGSGSESQAQACFAKYPKLLQGKIKWLGHVSEPELMQLYSKAMGLLFLSTREGFGIPLLEAARYSLPIIAPISDVSKEVMGDSVFWYDDSLDISPFKSFLIEKNRSQLAEQAKQQQEKFSWAKTASSTLKVYQEAVSI